MRAALGADGRRQYKPDMMMAAMEMAGSKCAPHLSQPAATRRQCLMTSMNRNPLALQPLNLTAGL
jgi:hypothetical protein